MWVDISIIILAIFSMLSTWKYIYEVEMLYNKIKLKNRKKDYDEAYKKSKLEKLKIKTMNIEY